MIPRNISFGLVLLTFISAMPANAQNEQSVSMGGAADNVTKFAIGPFNGSFDTGCAVECFISGPNNKQHSDHYPLAEYVIIAENPNYPYQHVNILLDEYETNITSLKGVDTDYGGVIIKTSQMEGGTFDYTFQPIDGKIGIVMEGRGGNDPTSLNEYGAAFHITPRIVCSIYSSDLGNKQVNLAAFRSVVKSIHINFDGRDPSQFKESPQKLVGRHTPA